VGEAVQASAILTNDRNPVELQHTYVIKQEIINIEEQQLNRKISIKEERKKCQMENYSVGFSLLPRGVTITT